MSLLSSFENSCDELVHSMNGAAVSELRKCLFSQEFYSEYDLAVAASDTTKPVPLTAFLKIPHLVNKFKKLIRHFIFERKYEELFQILEFNPKTNYTRDKFEQTFWLHFGFSYSEILGDVYYLKGDSNSALNEYIYTFDGQFSRPFMKIATLYLLGKNPDALKFINCIDYDSRSDYLRFCSFWLRNELKSCWIKNPDQLINPGQLQSFSREFWLQELNEFESTQYIPPFLEYFFFLKDEVPKYGGKHSESDYKFINDVTTLSQDPFWLDTLDPLRRIIFSLFYNNVFLIDPLDHWGEFSYEYVEKELIEESADKLGFLTDPSNPYIKFLVNEPVSHDYTIDVRNQCVAVEELLREFKKFANIEINQVTLRKIELSPRPKFWVHDRIVRELKKYDPRRKEILFDTLIALLAYYFYMKKEFDSYIEIYKELFNINDNFRDNAMHGNNRFNQLQSIELKTKIAKSITTLQADKKFSEFLSKKIQS